MMRKGRISRLLGPVLTLLIPYFPSVGHATIGTGGQMFIHFEAPQGTNKFVLPFRNSAHFNAQVAKYFSLFTFDGFNAKHSVEIFRDPSIAYNLEFTNETAEVQPYLSTLQFPINPLGANTISAELLVNLIDANLDGQVSLVGNVGSGNALQSTAVGGTSIGPAMGASITTPGVHSFVLSPTIGPTPAGNMLSLRTDFLLSPGDSVQLTSRFIIDEGTGIPFAEIPPLPDLADGPFFNVINVSSSETSLGNDFSIGAQTQLNLMDGGTIGTNFSAGDPLFLTPDIEVNIMGGTLGDDFRAYNDSVLNISGGTTSDVFMLGDSTANVTGGNVGFLRVTGGTVNVAAGVVAGLRIDEGKLTISGGTVNTTVVADGGVTTISGGQFNGVTAVRPDGGEVNITGGTFAGDCSLCITTPASGSVVNVSGGSFGTNFNGLLVVAGADAVLNIFGGTFTPRVIVRAGNELNLFGTEFLLDGAPIDGLVYGEALEISTRNVALSGLLADGSSLRIDLNTVEAAGADAVSADATLTVTVLLPGDYNRNGIVDAADYVVWRDSLGQTGLEFYTGGDGNGDGRVTAADYGVWKTRFSDTWAEGGRGQHAAVPEPSSLLLLDILGFGGALRRRRW